ncbi:hypothetical protein MPH_03299 [Macrophomina phaseolina MS6]|uniref:Uncharacterized protein n=2 Tax=Macrophomina phaseolina TaxID=35725 RepID=K2RAD5_MACPH|nr:hypothetical protein MPH_03299 [Macrophomina phaseolina MS6]KAH7027106.1 hypothetical protein B0J12DRAFT_357320 [Macrophomina phaseolina]
MPIRNPFRRAPGTIDVQQENSPIGRAGGDSGFQNAKTTGTSPVDVKDANYQLCEINDSGVFLPPSPEEKKAFWGNSKSRTSTSSNHRAVLNETEPFTISRESFESYRRSFDISARSPVVEPHDIRPRQSLDSRRLPRSSLNERRFERPISTTEEDFEDVGLNDEPPKPQQKKKGFFARFGDSSENLAKPESRPSSGLGFHHLTGRKRGQSGQGAELSPMPRSVEGTQGVSVESN